MEDVHARYTAEAVSYFADMLKAPHLREVHDCASPLFYVVLGKKVEIRRVLRAKRNYRFLLE